MKREFFILGGATVGKVSVYRLAFLDPLLEWRARGETLLFHGLFRFVLAIKEFPESFMLLVCYIGVVFLIVDGQQRFQASASVWIDDDIKSQVDFFLRYIGIVQTKPCVHSRISQPQVQKFRIRLTQLYQFLVAITSTGTK